jgi:hypothetical protein
MIKKVTLMAVAALCVLASGVQANPKAVKHAATVAQDANAAPSVAQVKAIVNGYIHQTFFDPYSVQDLTIAPPFWDSGTKGWVIRFECNAKNPFGAYVGIKQMALVWKNGGIDSWATQNWCYWHM